MHAKNSTLPILEALAAAILFAVSTPLSKILIGDIDLIPMAAFLYLGSGVGAFLFSGIVKMCRGEKQSEVKFKKSENDAQLPGRQRVNAMIPAHFISGLCNVWKD